MDGMKWWKEKLDAALKPRPRKKREPSIYASFNERLMATGIDMALLFVVLNDPARVISARIYSHLPDDARIALMQSQGFSDFFHHAVQTGFVSLYIINFLMQVTMVGVLYITFQSWLQTTPGKWIMGLKLTTADHETFPATWRLLLRFMGYGVATLPCMAGFLWIHVDPQRRGWHDRIAGTRVVTTRLEGWYWGQVKNGFRWLRARLAGE